MGHPAFAAGKVVVVTGAALGIGRAIANRCAARGMRVVLADLAGPDLDDALACVRATAPNGSDQAVAVATDVANIADLEGLRAATLARFGRVDVLVNNAVTRIGRGFDAERAEWRRAIDVNFWGVVNGVDVFLEDLTASDGPAVIVNVGSKQGITNPPGHPIYNIAKAAVKTYSEALAHDLRSRAESKGAGAVTVHLLVPGWTTTGHNEPKPGAATPEAVADQMLMAIAAGQFYILCPDGEVTVEMDHRRVAWAAGDIIENRPALSRWHPDFAARAKTECS